MSARWIPHRVVPARHRGASESANPKLRVWHTTSPTASAYPLDEVDETVDLMGHFWKPIGGHGAAPKHSELLEVPEPLIETALNLELEAGDVVADQVEGPRHCVFLAGLYRAEQTIAERL